MRRRSGAGYVIPYAAALLVLLGPAAQASADERDMLLTYAETTERTCRDRYASLGRAQDAKRSEQDRVLSDLTQRLECECVPAGIRAGVPQLVQAMRADKRAEFDAILLARVQECQARVVRESFKGVCLADESHARAGASTRESLCSCVAAEVRALDDTTIIEESIAAHKNFEQRVKDRTIPKHEGKIAAIEKRCAKAAGR